MSDPLVSVIIPCRLDEDLTEIFRWPDWAEMLFQFEDGIGTARNAGAELARAPILAFTDADVRLTGALESVATIPDIDAAWTADRWDYTGPEDFWSRAGVTLLNGISELAYAGVGRRMVHASLMVCRKRFFRPFEDLKQEDVRWGDNFPVVYPLPVMATWLRKDSGPIEWRRRRGQPV